MSKNVTLAIEEDLLLAARKVALERRTTVNHLVREYLASLVNSDSRLQRARANLKRAFANGVVEAGVRDWSRDDLHER